eukprot:TRINITY_DN7927_c0_g1_i10.p1 TRINITY_DN7927_c0_g1~~TRINITY_DN7927_c0_g1_i10.p1  ORF type:complete len:381 (-),score=68.60 TRINITY_DN7927_c0_g1_i10:879-2021(-)
MQYSYSIESGWEEKFQSTDESSSNCWATRKLRDQKGIHVDLHKNGNEITDESGQVCGHLKSHKVLNLTWESGGVTFLAPNKCFDFKKQITSISVSSGGLGLFSTDNKAVIFDTQDGEVRREFTEHVAEIYCGRLFPSGIVGLTCGADMRLKIWSAADGKCPVTLVGHTKAVTDMDFIERGRNIISTSKDGCLKVWNAGSSSCTATIETGEILNSCCILNMQDSRKVETDDMLALEHKIGVAGGELGTVFFIQLSSQNIIARYKCDSSVNIVVPSSNSTVLVGCENGEVIELDAKCDEGKKLNGCHISNSPVTALLHLGSKGFVCGRQDGTCTVSTFNSKKQTVLSGSDCEKISGLTKDDIYIFTSSRDGVVRKYRLDNIN